MQAVAIQEFGGPEGLAVIDVPEPKPAVGQVLVATEAIGVGGVDAVIRSGSLGTYGFQPGHVLGSEIAGTVTEVGEDVDRSWIGRRVWAFTFAGGYAERAVASVDNIVALPADVSSVDAVTVTSSAVVAHYALRHAHFAEGESVLVRGAAGGIGIMAVQLAARAGAREIAVTTSSAERGERLRALGATQVLDRAGTDGTGYDVIIDIVGGPDLPSFFGLLNPNGRLVIVGAVAGFPPVDFGKAMIAAFQQSLSFATFSLDTIAKPDRNAAITDLLAATARGELRSVVHEVLPLTEAVAGHRKMAAGEVFGRLVLLP